MLLNKCDRCGDIYEKDLGSPPKYNITEYREGFIFDLRKDLCPTCAQELEHFMQNNPSRSVIDVTYQNVKPKGFRGFLGQIFKRKGELK